MKRPLTVAEAGRLGGIARSKNLSKKQKAEISRKAGKARASKLGQQKTKAIASQGGKVGGKRRAAALSPARRKEIAQKAAKARYGGGNGDK